MNLMRQLYRYALVSSVALAVDVGLLYLLTEKVGLNYLVSASLAFLCGLTVNYLLSLGFVFSASRLNRRREFLLFSLIGLLGLVLNDLIIYLLVMVQVWYMTAKLAAAVAVFFFNFFLRRLLYQNNV